MDETPETLANRLEEDAQKTIEFFESIRPEQWKTQVYSDGAAWDLHHLLAHIVDAEESVPKLIARVASGGPGVPDDFDLKAYNERRAERNAQRSPEELIEKFRNNRVESVAVVRGLTSEGLKMTGRHPFLGYTEVVEMIKIMYIHVQLHQRDIRRTLKQT